MKDYFYRIYKTRYFWTHLSLADIRAKYRRSVLGVFWSILQPLGLTMLLAFVMGKLFSSPIGDYAPFVFSGIILWDFIVGAGVTGCSAFINSEGYIKQMAHPMAIYPLRCTLSTMINLLMAFIGFIFWVMVWKPQNFGFAWLHLIPSFVILFGLGYAFSVITAFINTKYRDFQQMIMLMLQAVWYVSPIFFEPRLFKSVRAGYLVDINPIYHILNLFRAPTLYGIQPTVMDYVYSCGTLVVMAFIAVILTVSNEKKLIYYL